MRTLIAIALLLFAITANAQLIRGAGVGYTNGVPNHNPGALGSPQAIDTITGYWYQYEYTTGVWRQAGFWLQPTGTTGAPSYTPGKQRQLFAINAGDSIYYYRSGAWRLVNGKPVAGDNITVNDRTISLDTLGLVRFMTDQTYSNGAGTLGWDNDYKTLAIGLTSDLDLRLGQNEMYHVLNDTAATLLKGRVVRASGTTGSSGKIKANYFLADGNTPGRYLIGVVAENIANGAEGYVMAFGLVRGINASGSPYSESWANGDILYANPTVMGGLTKVRPLTPNEEVVVAIVVNNSATVGSIFVRPQFPMELGELSDVLISTPTNGQVLSYSNGTWVNAAGGSGMQYSDTTSLIATKYFVTSQGYLTAEVDGSTTNELQNLGLSGQSLTITNGTGVTLPIVGITAGTGISTSTTSGNVTITNTAPDQTVSITGAGINTVGGTYPNFTITGTEVDGSTTNEIQTIDTFAIAGKTVSLSLLNDGQAAKTLVIPADTATYLVQDSILVYFADGVEFGRDTISGLSGGGGGLSGGVANYLPQYTSATAIDTTGLIWTGGQLGIAQTSPAATLHVTGAGSTSATSSLVVENSAGTDKLVVKDDGAVEIGRNASGTTEETASITVTGSETNIGLALITKGDGALTADIPDGTTAGGNARGGNAVDLQQGRLSATQVASGQYSVISGGFRHTASGQYSAVGGGLANTASGLSSFSAGGNTNTASASNAAVIGGNDNTASGNQSVVLGGSNNTASGTPSFVLGTGSTASAASSVCLSGNSRATISHQVAMGTSGFSSASDAQASILRVYRAITGEAKTQISANGGAENSVLNLPTGATAGRVWNARIQLVAVVQTLGSGPDSIALGSSFIGDYMVGIKRIGSTTSLVGSVQTLGTPQADNGMETSVVTITADDTNEALKIEFTPPDDAVAATVIRVVATVYLTEVGY
jgi:hypothetical protein